MKSLELPCIKCGEIGCLTLNLNGLDDSAAFTCAECNGEFGIEEVQQVLGAWSKALAWIETAPVAPQLEPPVAE